MCIWGKKPSHKTAQPNKRGYFVCERPLLRHIRYHCQHFAFSPLLTQMSLWGKKEAVCPCPCPSMTWNLLSPEWLSFAGSLSLSCLFLSQMAPSQTARQQPYFKNYKRDVPGKYFCWEKVCNNVSLVAGDHLGNYSHAQCFHCYRGRRYFKAEICFSLLVLQH